MNIKKLNQQNEEFQKAIMQFSKLILSEDLMNTFTLVIGYTKKIQSYFEKLASYKTELELSLTIDKMENHIDDAIFILDQIEIVHRKKGIQPINDVVKDGYNLLSIYSMQIDLLIESKICSEK